LWGGFTAPQSKTKLFASRAAGCEKFVHRVK
jgi:hypothetical protein